MTWFNGEQIVEVETQADEAGLPRDLRDHNHRRAVPAALRGGPDVRRLGEDQQCGGGRRIIRKRIGD